MNRPEHATISIAHDLDKGQHRLACAAELAQGKVARELILQAKRLRRIRRLFLQGEVSHGIAQAFVEACNLIADMAEKSKK